MSMILFTPTRYSQHKEEEFIAQLICSPFADKAADKIGRKRVLVTGLFLFGFSEVLFGLGQVIEILFLARILGGVSSALIMPAVTAFIADITTLEARPKALGYMSAAINTGFIIGPGIGGFLADFGTRTPFFFAGALGAVAALLSIIFLKEPGRSNKAVAEVPELKTSIKRMLAPMYFIAFTLILIASFGLSAFESFFALFVDGKFFFTPKEIAFVITAGALLGALIQILLFDRLALVTTLAFIGFDLFRPAVTSYLSKIAGNEQGFVGGMNSMFTSMGNIFGPIIGGILFDVDIDYPFYFSVAVMVLGVIITLFWKKPSRILQQ